jgi:hypothetical protein
MERAAMVEYPVLISTMKMYSSNGDKCGLMNLHSFDVVTTFYLRNSDGGIEHKMHALRNPRGYTHFFRKWNGNDTMRWT